MTTPTRDEAVPTDTERFIASFKPKTPRDAMALTLLKAWVKSDPKSLVAEYPTSYLATFVDMADAVLASAPAPASGGVDAAREYAIKALYQFADCTGRHWRNVGKGGPGFVDELDGTEQIAIDAIVALSRASLSPAATHAPAVDPNVERLLTAAKAAKRYLEPDLVEPGRTVFWNLVSAINAMEGKP